jgi:AcrR family transcriptional regulator
MTYLGRMTNQRRQANVREDEAGPDDRRSWIVAAARKLLAEEGYDRLTMKQVAREAGVAQGLIHYYFSGKDEILLEVLMEASRGYARETERLARSLPEGRDLTEAALAATRERVSRMPEWYRLRYELFAMGLRKPEFLPGIAALLDSGREGIAATLGRIATGEDTEPTPQREALAAVLLSCFDGLALQKLANPEGFDLEAAYDTLANMAEGWYDGTPGDGRARPRPRGAPRDSPDMRSDEDAIYSEPGSVTPEGN